MEMPWASSALSLPICWAAKATAMHGSRFFDGPSLSPHLITYMSLSSCSVAHTLSSQMCCFKTEAQASMQSHRQRIPKSHSCLRFSSLSWAADRKAKLLSEETVCVKGSGGKQLPGSAAHQVSSRGALTENLVAAVKPLTAKGSARCCRGNRQQSTAAPARVEESRAI